MRYEFCFHPSSFRLRPFLNSFRLHPFKLMPQATVLTNIWDRLTAPDWPRTALSISETHLALTTLRKRGSSVEPSNLGVLRLPKGLVRAHFTEPNITSEADLLEKLRETVAQ